MNGINVSSAIFIALYFSLLMPSLRRNYDHTVSFKQIPEAELGTLIVPLSNEVSSVGVIFFVSPLWYFNQWY